MATSESAAGSRRREAGDARRIVLRWFAWAASVLVLSILAQRIGGAAHPRWAEEVALVLVIGVATVAAPPVLARISRPSPDLPRPFEGGQGASAMPMGPSRGPSSLAG